MIAGSWACSAVGVKQVLRRARLRRWSAGFGVLTIDGARPGRSPHHIGFLGKGWCPERRQYISFHPSLRATEISFGATRTMSPYTWCMAWMSCTRDPVHSEKQWRKRKAAHAFGPGYRARGWKNKFREAITNGDCVAQISIELSVTASCRYRANGKKTMTLTVKIRHSTTRDQTMLEEGNSSMTWKLTECLRLKTKLKSQASRNVATLPGPFKYSNILQPCPTSTQSTAAGVDRR